MVPGPAGDHHHMDLMHRWNRWWSDAGARGNGDAVGAALLAAWAEPHRHYHTQRHLTACLTAFDRWSSLAANGREVELALWFHDAVYDLKARDNEARSAAWARRVCDDAGLSCGERVAALVEATAHGDAPLSGDAALVVDVDLAMLAGNQAEYDEYAAAVRREYGFVSDVDFAKGRSAVLERFLARPAIYHTPAIHNQWERKARVNLRREVQRLAG